MDLKGAKTLEQAARRYGEGRLEHAEGICNRLLARWPDAVDVLHLLALVRRRRGDMAGAETLFERCLALDPARADIRANLGNLLAASERLAGAERAYRDALARSPAFRPARLGLGRVLHRQGAYAEAAACGEALTRANGADAEGWAVLGAARRAQGLPDDAEAAWRKALRANPGYGAAHYGLAALLSDAGRCEEALVALDLAARAGVGGPEIDFTRASTLFALYRLDEAERLLEQRLQSEPRLVAHQRLFARIRFMRGAEDFAERFGAAVRAHPADAALRLAWCQLLRGAGLLEEARAAAEEGLAGQPGEPRLQVELAAVHQEAGRFADARDCARRALGAQPEARAAHEALADALLSLGEAASAEPVIAALRRRAPLNQWYVAMEATAARLLGSARYEYLYDYERFVRVFSLEPPPGWSTIDAFHRDLVPVLLERHRFRRAPLDQSLRAGTQTPRSLLGDPSPVIRAWLEALAAPLDEYRAAIGNTADHPFTTRNHGATRLAGCWSVLLRRGGYHVNHVHPQGWISSAYYVEVPPESAALPGAGPPPGWLQFGQPRFPVPGAEPAKRVQPVAGRLVLFPSCLWHGTTPLCSSERRLTIAFDAVPAAGS